MAEPLRSQDHFAFLLASAYFLLPYLLIPPLPYRWFRLRPLHYPACPCCKAPDGPWGVKSKEAPVTVEELVCGRCLALVEFWYCKPKAADVSSKLPVFELRWPRHLGRWAVIKTCDDKPVKAEPLA